MPIYSLEEIAPEFPADGRYWIAPTAVVIGRVQLMTNASIWFGAVLRGDNDLISIGENSNIQDNVLIHTDLGQPVTVGANATVGHSAILHSTAIGDNSIIGMGATLLNRSRIGKNCIVGANALVTEGKEFPDGMLIVGTPARAMRPLTDAELMLVKASADIYVANYRRFVNALRWLD